MNNRPVGGGSSETQPHPITINQSNKPIYNAAFLFKTCADYTLKDSSSCSTFCPASSTSCSTSIPSTSSSCSTSIPSSSLSSQNFVS
jgi:hypothetical protein